MRAYARLDINQRKQVDTTFTLLVEESNIKKSNTSIESQKDRLAELVLSCQPAKKGKRQSTPEDTDVNGEQARARLRLMSWQIEDMWNSDEPEYATPQDILAIAQTYASLQIALHLERIATSLPSQEVHPDVV